MRKSIKDVVINWWNTDKKRIFIISGYAGCGKTTTAREIPDALDLAMVSFLAPTGKAARVLHPNAQTIHSYLYEPLFDEPTQKLTFTMKPRASFYDKLLIVDEISMVNEELLRDLKSLYIPIIGLGDPAQLPPVHGNNTILNTPDIFLTKVYRNDGGILALATDIRMKRDIKYNYENVLFRTRIYQDLHMYDEESIIICRYNKTRQKINRMIRERVYNYEEEMEIGEKLIILNNSRETGLMNGSIVILKKIVSIDESDYTAEIVVMNENGFNQSIDIDLDIIRGIEEKPKKFLKKEYIHEIDYAYCITCHKAQGSEFEQVFLLNQGQHFDDHNKWFYTAVTRARKKLFIYN